MRCLAKSFASFLVVVFIMSLITLQPTLVSAQTSSNTSPPATQWQKSYGFGNTAGVSNLIQTSDGGYAFLDFGYTFQLSLVPSTLYKLDSSGNMQWNKTINFFTGSTIIQTSDGGYEIAGEWNTYGTTYQTTPTLLKLNSEGDIQWYENMSSVPNLGITSSNENNNNGSYTVGNIQTSDGGFVYWTQGSITKTDSNNDTQWVKNLTFPTFGYNGLGVFSVIETSDGALAILGVGYELGRSFPEGYIYLIKTEAFLPLPSQSPLPTPLPSPTPTPFMITVNEQILITALIAVVVALSIVLLIYRRHRKT